MSTPFNPIDVGEVAGEVMGGLDELFTSDEERDRAKLLFTKEINQPHILQALTNLQEAKHPSVFVSGWRPALGWLCVVLLAYAWIGRDLLFLLMQWQGSVDAFELLPELNAGEMMTLVLALLGLGATRTVEKVNGVARTSWVDRARERMNRSGAAVDKSETEAKTKPEASREDFSDTEKRKAFRWFDEEMEA